VEVIPTGEFRFPVVYILVYYVETPNWIKEEHFYRCHSRQKGYPADGGEERTR